MTEVDAQAIRLQEINARKQQMPPRGGSLRVLPRDDNVRRVLKHPIRRIGFPKTGSVEWPNDRFTRRRLADGSVTLEETKHAANRGHSTPAAER